MGTYLTSQCGPVISRDCSPVTVSHAFDLSIFLPHFSHPLASRFSPFASFPSPIASLLTTGARHLRTTLVRLFGSVHLPNIENAKEAASESEDEAVADGVHKVDALGKLVRGLLRGGRTRVPEADFAIPGTGDDGI